MSISTNIKIATGLIAVLLCAGSTVGGAWADILHYYNGKVVTAEVSRMTGDIIELDGKLIGRTNVSRLELTNRRDVVETRNHQKYFGEILYIDKFKVEMDTAAGRRKIPRLFVTNIVLGSPKAVTQDSPYTDDNAVSEYDAPSPAAPSEEGMHPVSYRPAAKASHPKAAAKSSKPVVVPPAHSSMMAPALRIPTNADVEFED